MGIVDQEEPKNNNYPEETTAQDKKEMNTFRGRIYTEDEETDKINEKKAEI